MPKLLFLSCQAFTPLMGMTRAIVPQMRIGLYINQVFFRLFAWNILVRIPDSDQLVYKVVCLLDDICGK
ncbi:hypothetical protein [Anabaena catenula]|uniref:Secreted protein n=1 Tax=Anabaena catenula FACHB-362 TaxID=2692877 RepID=A0ABR8IVY0_9NOST|nr:hypothetical protein [Anabaena catenula]MBD2690216.1 hypothetical protein [Anabaena catenula FACHB-362]